MNKKNGLLLGCLALLLVLSVGYALFSETITINGTAKAKGDFDIEASCTKGYSNELVEAGVFASVNEGQTGYSGDSCDVSGNAVTFSTSFSNPGAIRYFTVKLTNKGSIPATFDMDKVTEDYMVSNLEKKVCHLNQDGTISTNCSELMQYTSENGSSHSANIYKYTVIGLEKKDGSFCEWDDDCMNDFTALETGMSLYYVMSFEWPSDYASGYDNGFSATASMEFPFIQVTAQ